MRAAPSFTRGKKQPGAARQSFSPRDRLPANRPATQRNERVASAEATAADAGSRDETQHPSGIGGQIAYDLYEFCHDHGHPDGKLFTFEVTCHAITYVFANIAGTVHAQEVIFDLSSKNLICTRKAH